MHLIRQLSGQLGSARLHNPTERNRAIKSIGQIECRAASPWANSLSLYVIHKMYAKVHLATLHLPAQVVGILFVT